VNRAATWAVLGAVVAGFVVIDLKIVEHGARIKEFDDALAEASVKIVGLTERVAQLDGENKVLASDIKAQQLAFRDEYGKALKELTSAKGEHRGSNSRETPSEAKAETIAPSSSNPQPTPVTQRTAAPVADVLKLRATPQDRTPSAISQPPPSYPAALLNSGINEGWVRVRFTVGKDGQVKNAEAIGASRGEFVGAALDGVASWLFLPGVRNGQTAEWVMEVPIVFSAAGK
jgi:TonB family protein